MNYDPQTWQDEILTGEERFTIKDNAGNVLNDDVQIVLKTPVLQAGSDVTASRMNHMEAGIANAGKGFYQAFTRISVSETDPNPPSDEPPYEFDYGVVYAHPYNGNTYPQWDASRFVPVEFSLLSLPLEASINLTWVYDVFLWQDGETVRAVFGPKWTADTARGTGTGTAELETLNGVSVNKNSMTVNSGTYSYTMPARAGTLIGTVSTYTAGKLRWSTEKKSVWNKYNRLPQFIKFYATRMGNTETQSFSGTSTRTNLDCAVLGEPQTGRITHVAHITNYDAGTTVNKCWVHASFYSIAELSVPEDAVYTPEFVGVTSTSIKTTTTFFNSEPVNIGKVTAYFRVNSISGISVFHYSGSKQLLELEM